MMEWVILASNGLMAVLRILFCMILICRLLSAERPDKKGIIAAIIGGVAVNSILLATTDSEVYRIGLEVVVVTLCANCFQQTDIRKSMFISIIYEIGVSLWTFMVSVGLGLVFCTDSFMDGRTWQGQAVAWLLHLLLVALAVILLRKEDMERRDGFRLASGIAMVGFMGVVALTNQTTLSIPQDTFTMWMILAMILLMSVKVYNMNYEYEVEKELAKLKSEQAELLERDYTALNHSYSVNAKLFHDFHNHIGALRNLLSHQSYDKAMQYLDELQEPIQEMTDKVWTGDETVDYLINSKVAATATQQIQLQVQVEFPRHTNVRSADLCAILGNLLDNAIDAVKKNREPQQRVISLTIRRINQMLVIKVENPFSDSLHMEDGVLRTTKTDGGLHGWGLKSARTAAEKYDGMVRTTVEGNVFRAVATLSYQGISSEVNHT